MKKQLFMMVAVLTATAAVSQPKFSKPHGLYDESSLNVTITPKDASAEVFYTTDGSTPTTASTRYTAPLTLKETTLLRAIEVKTELVLPSPLPAISWCHLYSVSLTIQ